MVLGGMGLSFTGLFVLFGIHEVLSPGPVYPEHNRKEGAGVLCFVSGPFAFCVFLVRRGLALWRSTNDFDRLVSFAAKQPGASLGAAASSLSIDPGRLERLATEGATRGFITDLSNAELSIGGAALSAGALVDAPGRNPLLTTLAGHAYGVLCAALFAFEKAAGRNLILLVCFGGIPLLLVLHTIGVVGGVTGLRAARRTEPPGSMMRPLAALILGVLGYLAVCLLVFATALELSFGPR